jgi:DNA damage-inducible protein 1
MSDITITLCNPATGQSESMPVAPTLSVSELLDWSKAVLGMEGNLILVKDGKPLATNNPSLSLSEAGVVNDDLLVVMKPRPAAPAAPGGGGGLNFSNLLGGGGAAAAVSTLTTTNEEALYYAGMTLSDAVLSNPHPKAIVKVLQQHSHLFKELNYHNPILARKLQNQPYDKAVQIWREDRVKGSISSASAISQAFHKEQDYTRRLLQDHNDLEAKEYFKNKERKEEVQQQYQQAMQEYPESMGRVLMLYIEAKINNHRIQAFVDSGAQATIMSKRCAQKCGIFDLVDTRFAGVAVGVGTGKILGRIHIAQLQIGHIHFPCSVTVMDDTALPSAGNGIASENGDAPKPKDMDFLLGLDMLKRHNCCIDLEQGKLKFRLEPGQYLETPFLHEKDLDESKGGTKGFNAEKANEELMEAQRKFDEEGGGGKMEED